MKILRFQCIGLYVLFGGWTRALQLQQPPTSTTKSQQMQHNVVPTTTKISRRSALFNIPAVVTAATLAGSVVFPEPSVAAGPNGLPLTTSSSGLKWADAKVGTGQPVKIGSPVSIDYSMASTAGRFPQIYTTKDKGAPYRWTLGDGTTIEGIEKAILGDDTENIPPMLPGGIRRVIVPASLGYEGGSKSKKCIATTVEEGGIGPIPPKEAGDGAFQRWVQFYCNPRIPYQPDLVLDIKLYGKRSL